MFDNAEIAFAASFSTGLHTLWWRYPDDQIGASVVLLKWFEMVFFSCLSVCVFACAHLCTCICMFYKKCEYNITYINLTMCAIEPFLLFSLCMCVCLCESAHAHIHVY